MSEEMLMMPPKVGDDDWLDIEPIDAKGDDEAMPADMSMGDKLNSIIVTIEVEGVEFSYQADERSRNLIAHAVNAAEVLKQDSAGWRMANNEWRDTSLDELRMISARGLMRHGEIMAGKA